MALRGKYEQSRMAMKIFQWLGCIFFLSIIAMGCIMLFPQPLTTTSLKWLQLIQTIAIFLLPPLCMAYLWSEQPLQWLQLATPKLPTLQDKSKQIILAIGIMLVALPGINLLSHLNHQMTLPAFLEPLEQWMKVQEENAKVLTEQFLNVTTLGGLIINLLLMAVLPAVAEELTFRGTLQQLLKAKTNSHLAIWCSAILFSAIHFQFYGFIPRMVMGAMFGYTLWWTGSLWIPILMHFTNNAMAVLLYFLALRADWDMEQVDAIGTNDTLWLGVVSIVITIIGIYAFRRSTTMSKASSRISSGN